MTSAAKSTPPLAHAGPIGNALLDRVAYHAERAQHGDISDEAATLIIMCAGPLLRELQQHRTRAADGLDLSRPDNVVSLTPSPAPTP